MSIWHFYWICVCVWLKAHLISLYELVVKTINLLSNFCVISGFFMVCQPVLLFEFFIFEFFIYTYGVNKRFIASLKRWTIFLNEHWMKSLDWAIKQFDNLVFVTNSVLTVGQQRVSFVSKWNIFLSLRKLYNNVIWE